MSHAYILSDYYMDADQFMAWPGDGTGRPYQLVDGEPIAMAPPSPTHGLVQARVVFALTRELRARGSGCEVLIGPGVQPRPDMAHNVRVPDIAVTCTPPGAKFVDSPVLVAEILSPSNARETRDAVRAMLSIPSLQEVLILGSQAAAAELMRRAPDWPAEPLRFGPQDTITLHGLGVSLSMSELYDGLGLR